MPTATCSTAKVAAEIAALPPSQQACGPALRRLGGQGILCPADCMTRDPIAAGRLVPLLEDCATGHRQQIHAVYYRNTRLARRTSCFLAFPRQKL